MDDRSVTGLIGVYDADGGVLGELAYVWGKVRGTRHCSLCDITHGRLPWRRPEWDRMVADLGLTMDLLHLNEMPPEVRRAVAACGVPVVLALTTAGLRPLVVGAELDALDGSVARLSDLLRARLSADRA